MNVVNKLLKKAETVRMRLMSLSLDNQMWSAAFHRLVKKIKNIEAGQGSYGYLGMPSGTKIGNYCSIADGVKYLPGNHPVERVSTAACFYNPVLRIVDKKYDITRTRLNIGNDVWIGANVLITNKVTSIPNGVVIGAGSVVTRTPPPIQS